MPALSHPIKKRIPEASAVILLLLVGLAVWLGLRLLNEMARVRHTLEVQTKISEVRASLQATEIGQRSFVLTGDETFLEPFQHERERLGSELDELAQLVSDNPKQLLAVAEARPLIEQRLAGADQAILLRRRGDFERARDQVLDKDGLRRAQSVNDIFRQMLREEERLVGLRTAQATRTSRAAAITLGLGTWSMDRRREAVRRQAR
jgi:CHASE3 domain sensor protein